MDGTNHQPFLPSRTFCRILSSTSSALALALALRLAGSLESVLNNALSSVFSMHPLRFLFDVGIYRKAYHVVEVKICFGWFQVVFLLGKNPTSMYLPRTST